MATIKAFNERFQAFDIEKVLVEVLLDKKALVIEKNLDQLDEGFDANGNNMKQYAWQDYAVEKNQMNPKPGMGNPDLKYTGAFWQGFVLEATQGTEYEIKSTDGKASDLQAKYGEIYGMTGKSRSEFIEETYRNALANKVKDILQL